MSTYNKLGVVSINESLLWCDEISLRRKTEPIDISDLKQLAEAQGIIKEMFRVLYSDPSGVALAAPQLGVLRPIIIISYEDRETETNILHALINPRIIDQSEETDITSEICLSIPNFSGNVLRNVSVTVNAFDQLGNEVSITATGFLARVFQHEIDHINGILYIDRVEDELEKIPDFFDRRTKPTLKKLKI